MATQQPQSRSSFATFNGFAPEKGSRVLPLTVDLSLYNPYPFDLVKELQVDKMEWIQSIYVDNSANNFTLKITFGQTGQVLTWPANSQGYLPCWCPSPATFTVQSFNADITVHIWLATFPTPAFIWATSAASLGAIAIKPDISVDGSGTITVGGTAQNLFGGIAPVNGFGVYNPDATNDLWISDGGTAAANASASIRVPANGGWYETPVTRAPIGIVSIVGANNGQKFTAQQW